MATYGTSNKYINYSVNSQELSYDINSNSSILRVWVDGGLIQGIQQVDLGRCTPV